MRTRKPKSTTYEQIHDNHATAQRVEEGLPIMEVVEFAKDAGFTNEEFAKLINIPARTYARRIADKGRLKVTESERAARLMRVFDRAKRLFVSEQNTREWFNLALPALGWRTPLDFAQTEPGAREVESVIERLEDGVVM
jgi:putative toxin-antitoxin system antitoxin component (TIGR02293 family)